MAKVRGALSARPGPQYPAPVPTGADNQTCTIIYGHNVSVRKVLVRFNVATAELIFSPEEAEDMAARLQHYAKAARGEKTS